MAAVHRREGVMTYGHGIGTAQLLLQSTGVGLGNTRLVGVAVAHNATDTQEGSDEDAEVEEALASTDVGILLGGEDTENFVLLVNRLAKVSLLLLVPPSAVGVSELSLHARRVAVATVLRREELEMPSLFSPTAAIPP